MKWPRYTPYATEIHTEYVLQSYPSIPCVFRTRGLDKRAAGKLPASNPLGDSAPKVKALFDWNTVGSKKYASWLKSEAGLKDIYDGDWKPDPNSRGGLVTFKKEKCHWKRRIAKE